MIHPLTSDRLPPEGVIRDTFRVRISPLGFTDPQFHSPIGLRH